MHVEVDQMTNTQGSPLHDLSAAVDTEGVLHCPLNIIGARAIAMLQPLRSWRTLKMRSDWALVLP